MNLKMFAGAAAVAALIMTPAMAAQQKSAGAQEQSADSTGAKKMDGKVKKMHHSRAEKKTHRSGLEQSRASADNAPRSGFWPADVAAGVVGGAIGTAGAIATAPFTPFRGDSFAYYRDTNTGRGYIADDNGPKCLPGQMTTINGQKLRCQ
jgi:hypothetical protein